MANQYSKRPSIALSLVREAVKKTPNAPARRIAINLRREHPKLFRNEESARCQVRYALGQLGKQSHRAVNDATKRPARNAGDDWRKYMPEPREREPFKPFVLPSPCRCLILSDIHIPYHDKMALHLAIEYGLDREADCVLLNGDVMDHYALSRFGKDPRERDFPGEVKAGRAFLKSLRAAFPDALIVWKLGNHEERYEAYMQAMAPDFIGVDCFEWSNVFGLKEQNVKMVGDKRPIKLGKINVLHGHEYGGGSFAPVTASRSMFLKAHAHTISGHLHRVDHHSKPTLDGNLISNWSVGCLCDPAPRYRPLNDWAQGVAFVTVDKRGAFDVENRRIVDGRIWS